MPLLTVLVHLNQMDPAFVPSAQGPSLKRHLQPVVPRDSLLSLVLVLRQGWETVSAALA